jgi:DNA-3-methyladenine glycosylase I
MLGREDMTPPRCDWATSDPLYIDYHDTQWGVPIHDDRRLFEFLILEGAQAGLSWLTILKKREAFRAALDDFDPLRVARYGPDEIAVRMQNPAIVRNRRKLEAAVVNARAFLRLQEFFGSFDAYIWGFLDGRPIRNQWRRLTDVPAHTPLSHTISRELKQKGFRFVGPTICYAFMQAVGMVNDHILTCFRHREIDAAIARLEKAGQ